MRVLLPTAAVASALLTSCARRPRRRRCRPSRRSRPPRPAPQRPPTATPAATPEPESGPLATIEVTIERLTFRDADGLVIDELELEEGSEALATALNNHLGPAAESRVDEEGVCSEPGTAYTEWADAGAELRVVPPHDDAEGRFVVTFTVPETASELVVRIPDGPAIGEDARAFYGAVPEWQRADHGQNIGSMVYNLAPGVEEGAAFNDIVEAVGCVDHAGTLTALSPLSGHNGWYC